MFQEREALHSPRQPLQWNIWQWQMKNRLRNLQQLAVYMPVPRETMTRCENVADTFPFAVTPYYLSLAARYDEHDPILRQCLPDPAETEFSLGGVPDPLGEEEHAPVPGLIRRYPDRCLAIVTNSCATYCRHCNRKRRWKGRAAAVTRRSLQRQIDYIARTPAIREVIVSGGDPLTLSETTLDWFLGTVRSVRHVEVLRIGSRIPVVLPMRITPELCALLRRHRPLWFNTQFNHPREITPASARACEMLLEAGMPVSNQSVLLRGVNDSYETMRDLLHGLQRISVRPYYLFQCDPVAGTDHFRVEVDRGIEIMERIRQTTSGLCVPQYVIDAPGRQSKVPLFCSAGRAQHPGEAVGTE